MALKIKLHESVGTDIEYRITSISGKQIDSAGVEHTVYGGHTKGKGGLTWKPFTSTVDLMEYLRTKLMLTNDEPKITYSGKDNWMTITITRTLNNVTYIDYVSVEASKMTAVSADEMIYNFKALR